jgi:hypothetical protein
MSILLLFRRSLIHRSNRGRNMSAIGLVGSRVRARLPLKKRVHFDLALPGGIPATLMVLWLTRGQWAQRQESRDRSWSTVPIGCFVIALHLVWEVSA